MSTNANTATSEIAQLVYNNAIRSHQEEIELLGLELEYASGVRALAARQAMHESGGREHFDADGLFDAVDGLVGMERLFESYDDPCNTNPTDFVLGVGCPFESLDAYLDLRELFGRNWLVLAMTEYVAWRGVEGLSSDPRRTAEEMVARALDAYTKARPMKVRRFSDGPLVRFEPVT